MKKYLFKVIICSMLMVACANNNQTNNLSETNVSENEKNEKIADNNTEPETKSQTIHIPVKIKESPDKYTAYIKDYVGKNCATIGYEALSGNRYDRYPTDIIQLRMVTEDGSYIGATDEELKNYYVVAQNLEPNTEIKCVFQKDSEGNEYDNLTEWQNIDEIVLKVAKVGSSESTSDKRMTAIKISEDKYTAYVKDYEGRNLANCGYISMAGDLRDRYGSNNIELKIIAADGSYIEIEEDILKQYYVVQQNPEPNDPIQFEYSKDSNGEEYSFTSWQSLNEIEVYVAKLEN